MAASWSATPIELGCLGYDVVTGDERASRRGFQKCGEHPDRRRLPRAVRAEEAEDLAGLELEVDAVHGNDFVETSRQTLGHDRLRHRDLFAL